MNLPYFLYMAEAEGCTDVVQTRTAKINAAIKEFIKLYHCGVNINNGNIQDDVFDKLKLNNLSWTEKEYIAKQVEKRV